MSQSSAGRSAGSPPALVLRDAGFDVTIHERSRHRAGTARGGDRVPPRQRPLSRRAGRRRPRRHQHLHRAHPVPRPRRRPSPTTSPSRTGSARGTRSTDRCWPASAATGTCSDTRRPGCDAADDARAWSSSPSDAAERVDLLVCADGVGSGFRSATAPGRPPVDYAGYVAWRGMVPEAQLEPADAAALGDAITYYVFANSHILVYPIPGLDGSVEPGERLINFVWYRNYLGGRRSRRRAHRRRRRATRALAAAGGRPRRSHRRGPGDCQGPSAAPPRRRRHGPSSSRSCR